MDTKVRACPRCGETKEWGVEYEMCETCDPDESASAEAHGFARGVEAAARVCEHSVRNESANSPVRRAFVLLAADIRALTPTAAPSAADYCHETMRPVAECHHCAVTADDAPSEGCNLRDLGQDLELEHLAAIVRMLDQHDWETRNRMLRYLEARQEPPPSDIPEDVRATLGPDGRMKLTWAPQHGWMVHWIVPNIGEDGEPAGESARFARLGRLNLAAVWDAIRAREAGR